MDAVVPSAGNILDFAWFSHMQGYNRKLEEVDMTVWRGEIDTDQLGRGFAWPCVGNLNVVGEFTAGPQHRFSL